MQAKELVSRIVDQLKDVDALESSDTYFLFYQAPDAPQNDRMMPFATVVTNDFHDTYSNLSRPGAYRLNIGVRHSTYESMFGKQPKPLPDGSLNLDYDFTRFDTLMPHPVYAHMSWVCVLNPSEATLEQIKPLLEEAFDIAKRRK